MFASKTDLLSQVLTLIRLRGELVYTASLGGSVTFEFAKGPAHFHVVSAGRFWVRAKGERAALQVFGGDLLLLLHGEGHTLSDTLAGLDAPATVVTADHFTTDRLALNFGSERPQAALVGGIFRFEITPMPSITQSLPKIIHLARDGNAVPAWLTAISGFLLEESRQAQPGSSLMISRLIDLLVIRTVRTWAATRSDADGWLGGLRDERIVRALGAMHADPYRPWSVQSLSVIATMSRSIFAERFAETVGISPMRYLTRWRLYLAIDLLKSEGLRVAQVALRVGYDSEAAFSRAFKAQFGYSPSEARLTGLVASPVRHEQDETTRQAMTM